VIEMATSGSRVVADDFLGEVHVYERHRVGLPRLRPYARQLWRRRRFAWELSRTNLRAQHFDTAFGQLWLVITPLLLGFVYFLLVDIIRGGAHPRGFLANLLAGLFAFYFVSTSISDGSKSVTGGGKLILNTAFPRLLLPISSVITAFMRFLPTLLVYAVAHAVSGLRFSLHLLWAIPVVALLVLFSTGMAILFATLQVYFRDTRSFLPYFLRIWLYLSPVLYSVHDVPDRLRPFIALNPLYPMLGAWTEILNDGRAPSPGFLAAGLAWAVGTLLVGTLYFMSREREFAVRL
jgi:teichoic acid transport system permease protein